MLSTLLVVTSLALQANTDTTFAVRPDARLNVRTMGGDITIRTWNRAAVRIQAEHGSRDRLVVENTGAMVNVRSRSERGPGGIVDYQITVPATMNLDLAGQHSEITVEGTRADVNANTLNGDVRVQGGRQVSARSVQGQVVVTGARGRVQANSVSDDIRISDVEGEITAEAVSGDVTLSRIQSSQVNVSTVSGDLFYDGTIRERGAYRFATHSGDVVAAIPAGSSATVTVATVNGELDSSFPVRVSDARRGRRFSFALGGGSARLEMESFSGDIRLRRSGEVRPPAERR